LRQTFTTPMSASLSTDLLVAGGGIAGLAAAARAVELGLDVVVAEKGDRVGGSGALSAGIVWTAPDLETARRVAPEGDPALLEVLVSGFDPAVEQIRATGAAVSSRWHGQMGFGVACHVDIAALIEHWEAVVANAGTLLLGTAVRELLVDAEGAALGARLRRERTGDTESAEDGIFDVRAGAVLLATGGFQGDPELVKTLLGWDADAMPVRSNPWSVGDGLRMGRVAGASLSRCLGRFYGHLIPDRLERFEPADYLPLTQYHSNRSILVNVRGRRFVDESIGDETSNQLVLRQPEGRAVLLCDDRVRGDHAVGPPYPHGQVVDRFAAAAAAGGRLTQAATLDDLVERVAEWGVDPVALARTLADYEAAARGEAVALDAPLPAEPAPLREPPFHALAVAPCLTFGFGGLRVDVDGRVLDRDGTPIQNLYAAGADAGGLQGPGYVGGLILGMVFGPRAVEAIHAREASWPTPTS
jgi:succinate dehydrogenase/fumarate reductase flavoprotein subunit